MDILENKGRKEVFEQFFDTSLPTDSIADEIVETTRANGRKSLFFFTTAIANFNKVQKNPHLELCSYIQRTPKSRKVLLIPRDCYKSTVASKAFPLWILIQENFSGLPGREHRILCASFSSENAKKQIKAIRHLIERNTFLQFLYPEIIPDFTRTTWTDSNLLFPRDGVYGEDTIEAAGVDTHLVSRHYTIQIKDDLEDEKASSSPTVRKKVYDWYKAAEALFVDEQSAYDLLVGTRWGVDDLYYQIQQNESDTYEFLCRPLHWTQDDLREDLEDAAETGRPPIYNMDPERFAPDPSATYYFFPTIFPEASCKRIKSKQGSFMYSMLYLNNPKDPSNTEFKEKDFRFFTFDSRGNLTITREDGAVDVVEFDSLRRVLFWDPALAEADQKKGCRNAMICLAMDSADNYYILDALLEKSNPTFLYHKFIGLHKRYSVHKAGIEDVAFQRILKFPLYKAMKQIGHSFPVLDLRPEGEKFTRIRSLIPIVESHQLFIRRGLRDLIEELKNFPLFPTVDGIDALAAATDLAGAKGPMSEKEKWKRERRQNAVSATRSALTGY